MSFTERRPGRLNNSLTQPLLAAPYVRPAGALVLGDYTALSYFGAGSKEDVELFDMVTLTGPLGTPSYSTSDLGTGMPIPDVITIPSRYMAMSLSPNDRDMLSTEWTASPLWTDQGEWSFQRLSKAPFFKRMLQVKANPDAKHSRRSTFTHPEMASFSFRIGLGVEDSASTPGLGKRFTAISWGNRSWAIFFYPEKQPILAEWDPHAGWLPRLELSPMQKGQGDSGGETVFQVEILRNSIVITQAFRPDGLFSLTPQEIASYGNAPSIVASSGLTQDVYWRREGVYWPSGKFDIFGLGVQASWAVAELTGPNSGKWTSSQAPLFQPRGSILGMDLPNWMFWANLNGGAITYNNLNGASDYWFQYELTFFPKKQTIGSRTWYRSPDVEAVAILYPSIVVPGTGLHDNGATLDGRMLSWHVEKPPTLDEAQLSAKLMFPDGFRMSTGAWPMRPIKAMLGVERASGPNQLWEMFTGYVVGVHVDENPGEYVVEVQMESIAGSIRPKRKKFPRTTIPRGGRTLNQNLNIWAVSMGLTPGVDTAWDSIGDLITLPLGMPEDPSFHPTPKEDSWGWHQELCQLFGLELVWTDGGLLATFPKNGYLGTPAVWRANPLRPEEGMHELKVDADVLGVFSRLVVYAHSDTGEGIMRWAWNQAMEQVPGYRGFRNWYEEKPITLQFGPVPPAFADLCAYTNAEDWLVPRVITHWKGELAPNIGRRNLVTIVGDRMEAYGNYITESMEHDAPEDSFQATTTISAWRRL